ncbi:MAG: oxygen-independent coproporphyrinogen III oxidase-like protein, partial [Burkholderiaceae bacterium]|nr:oxygen-independent coproporphyrinogen III oxidase-like protein [Burkholderiaceae bacterium]
MIPIKPISATQITSKESGSNGSINICDVPAMVQHNYLSPGGLSLQSLPPLSLYIHFPWCVKKCPYCDFNSHEVKNQFDENAYLSAVRADLEAALPMIWGRKIYTIFIGGGT